MILYRYVLKEHFLPFVYSLGILIFIMLMDWAIQLLDKVLSKGLAPGVVLEIFLISLAWMVVTAVPMAVLISSLMVFGRMSADSEIMAIKASGLNVSHLILPVFVTALLLTVLLIFFNNQILPDANHRASNLMMDIRNKKPAALIEPGILINDFPGYSLYVNTMDFKTGDMKKVWIFSDARGEEPAITYADSGALRATPDGRFMQMLLFSGQTHRLGDPVKKEYAILSFGSQTIILSNVDSDFKRSNREDRNDREMSSEAMLARVHEAQQRRNRDMVQLGSRIDTISRHIDRLDSLYMLHGRISMPDDTVFTKGADYAWLSFVDSTRNEHIVTRMRNAQTQLSGALRNAQREYLTINQYLTEVHKKYAIPVACIVFVLIGGPLGIMVRKGGIAAAITYSLIFFVIYWACLIGGESLADRGVVPGAIAMWSANVILFVCGVVLVVLMIKEKTMSIAAPLKALFGRVLPDRQSRFVARLISLRRAGSAVLFGGPNFLLKKTFGILPSYLLRKFLGNLVGTIISLIIVFEIIDYVSNLKRFDGASMHSVMLFYWYYIPYLLNSFLPVGILLASMFSMGSLAKNSELTAMKASGVSIYQLTRSLLFFGVVLGMATFLGSERILPHANAKRYDIEATMKAKQLGQQVSSTPLQEKKNNFYYFSQGITVYRFASIRAIPFTANSVWRGTVSGPAIGTTIMADQMVMKNGKWYFVNGMVRSKNGVVVATFDTLQDSLINVTPEAMVTRIKKADEMGYWELKGHIEKARQRGENILKYTGTLYFKIALPVMNFIVILLGISITARIGRRGSAVLFGVGFMMVFGYWVIARFALAFGQNGYISPFAGAWLGNAIFFVISLVLLKRASR